MLCLANHTFKLQVWYVIKLKWNAHTLMVFMLLSYKENIYLFIYLL